MTDAEPDMMMELSRNLAARRQYEHERVDRTLGAMTGRERRLVREAAVMGYVRGARSVPGGHLAKIGPDADILTEVVSACLGMPDLYPAFALAGRARPAATTDDDELGPLGLTDRTRTMLRRGGYRTIAQLRAASDDDLLAVRNSGSRSLEDIRRALAAHLEADGA